MGKDAAMDCVASFFDSLTTKEETYRGGGKYEITVSVITGLYEEKALWNILDAILRVATK